jgi:hypothetical protein
VAADASSLSAFKVGEEGVEVKTPGGDYQQVVVPAGYNPVAFRNVLAAFNTGYRQLGRLPSLDETHALWPRIHKDTVGELLQTNEFKQALILRGIEPGDNMGLSSLQHAFLLKLADPYDKRSMAAKLKEFGITSAVYSNWRRYRPFAKALEEQSKALYNDALPAIRARLVGKAESGDVRAIEMVFDKTGESPKANELADVKQVVMTLVQAVQKHCDTPTRMAILADVQLTLTALNVAPEELTT